MATIIVVTALAAVSEIALPLLFAAVLAVIFKPVAGSLERRGFKPSLAAGVLVLGLLIVMTIVVTATVRGVLDQTDEIGASVDAAKEYAVTGARSRREDAGRCTSRHRRRGPRDR